MVLVVPWIMLNYGSLAMCRLFQNLNKLFTLYLYEAVNGFWVELFVQLFMEYIFLPCLHDILDSSENIWTMVPHFRVFCFCILKTLVQNICSPRFFSIFLIRAFLTNKYRECSENVTIDILELLKLRKVKKVSRSDLNVPFYLNRSLSFSLWIFVLWVCYVK